MSAQLSRRDLLRLRIGRTPARTPEQMPERTAARALLGFLRPPGAQPEPALARACDGCGECVRACPERAIRLLGPEYGAHAGTPVIDPSAVPCRACADTPCVASCASGALTSEPSQRVPAHAIGFRSERCWTVLGQPCDYCMDACPERPPALRVVRSGPDRGVVIDEGRCVGCGLCIFYCTATPRALEAAIR